MKTVLSAFAFCLAAGWASGQSYTSYFTGNEENIDVQPEFGLCLMGGAGESDEAMVWFLEKANGGDVVVIRTSGSDGYNDYMYSELGVAVNSVETIRFDSEEAATDPYVIDKLSNAEAIWMAGGNQATYVNYWKDTPVEDAINNLLNEVGGAVGGISAGTAILGQGYFGALAGTITQEEALANPFDNSLILGWDDFIQTPFMENVITETHTNDPDRIRYGRIFSFMARLGYDQGIRPLGMAPNEYCAIAIGEDGLARAFGEFPEFDDDYVYFLQPNCEGPQGPEIIEEDTPLTWNRGGEAVKVYQVPATVSGQNFFDLNDWNNGSGGSWENWYAIEGELTREPEPEAPECFLSIRETRRETVRVYPNPTMDRLQVEGEFGSETVYEIYDVAGRRVDRGVLANSQMDVSELPAGIYRLSLNAGLKIFSSSFVKH
ncbi:MAG: T9SS type A sorting domain-containing protein [Cryomorphaceae bacterium]|nr:T9SS type A sorting domain-containing protein [Flavobacteriales bacterium]